MNTSLIELSEFTDVEKRDFLTEAEKEYFRAMNRRHIYGIVVDRFVELADEGRISKADIARLLRASRSQWRMTRQPRFDQTWNQVMI